MTNAHKAKAMGSTSSNTPCVSVLPMRMKNVQPDSIRYNILIFFLGACHFTNTTSNSPSSTPCPIGPVNTPMMQVVVAEGRAALIP